MYCPSWCRNSTYQCGAANYPFFIESGMKICEISGPPIPSTAFALKQCLYQKEATCIESPKIYCSSSWKTPTYLCGSAKYPVSWLAVYVQEWKYAKFRAYQSPWCRVCTKAMVRPKGSYRYGELKNILP